jgi:hypothetical protein
MNKISPAQYRAHYYKEVDQIFILPRFSCASSPTISIDSGDCGSIIFLLIKLKIQTRSNDRFGLKLGTVLAHHGQRACPCWADLVSDTCPFTELSQRMQFHPSDNSSHQQTIQTIA